MRIYAKSRKSCTVPSRLSTISEATTNIFATNLICRNAILAVGPVAFGPALQNCLQDNWAGCICLVHPTTNLYLSSTDWTPALRRPSPSSSHLPSLLSSSSTRSMPLAMVASLISKSILKYRFTNMSASMTTSLSSIKQARTQHGAG